MKRNATRKISRNVNVDSAAALLKPSGSGLNLQSP